MRLFILIFILTSRISAQVSYEKALMIGDMAPTKPSLVLEVNTTTKGSIPCPLQTTAQAIARTPIKGECIFNTDTQATEVWSGSSWVASGGTTIYDWKANTLAGYSTSNLTVPYFTNVDSNNNISSTNCATITNNSTDGFIIMVEKASFISGSISASDMKLTYTIGFTKNPTVMELDESISLVPNDKSLCQNTVLGVLNNRGNCFFSQIFKSGDMIYLQLDKNLTMMNQNKFNINISCVLL